MRVKLRQHGFVYSLKRIASEEAIRFYVLMESAQKMSSLTLVGGASTISGCWNM